MRKSWLLCVLMGTLAWGQAAPGAPPPAQAAPAPAQGQQAPVKPPVPVDMSASVPDSAVVLTVTGVCPPQAKAPVAKGATAKVPAKKTDPADCKTTMTKADFEKLANALAPNLTPQLKRQLVGLLPRLLAFSEEAKKEGIDKTPQYAESLKFAKMQVLTNDLQRKIQKEAADIPDSEIEKHYKENPQSYEVYNVDRLFVPRTKQGEPEAKEDEEKDEKLTDEQKKAKEDAAKAKADEAEQAMTKLADDLHARAAKGEDFKVLQKEAFDAAGMKIESPNINLPSVRRTGLPPAHAAVLELKVGEVSQVISDSGGHYIYKVNSKTLLPIDQAKNEIHSKLQNDRSREAMDKLNNSFKVETNDAYFGPGGASPMQGRGPRPRPGMPMSQQGPAPQGPPQQSAPQQSAPQQAPPPAQPPAAQPN